MAALQYFAFMYYQNQRERHQRREVHLFHRNLRDASDVFQLPDYLFIKLFRLNKEATHMLIQELTPLMSDGIRSTSIPIQHKIMCTLNFLGHGCYQLDTGTTCHFPMSQSSVSRCIAEVCEVINNNLLNRWVMFPRTPELINKNIQRFFDKYGFPDTIGSIDCTHIAIISPPKEHPVYPAGPYYNRKGYYSINVQLIANAELKILNINAKYPGSVHDSAIWQMSAVNNHLQRVYLLENNLYYHLVGDEGYPISPWLLTQYPGNVADDSPEGQFNIYLRRARIVIERVNGILKGRFRCLLKHRTLNYNPIKAGKIINTCAVLHNIALHFNVAMPNDEEFLEVNPEIAINVERQRATFYVQGTRKRDSICHDYFH